MVGDSGHSKLQSISYHIDLMIISVLVDALSALYIDAKPCNDLIVFHTNNTLIYILELYTIKHNYL